MMGRWAAAMGLAAAMVLSGGASEAAFIAYICNDVACAGGGLPDVIVTDQGAGDTNPVAGVIVAQGAVGGLLTSVNVSQSKPAVGSATAPQVDLNFTATGVGDVWLYASDTGFTGVAPFILQVGGVSTGSPISVAVSVAGGSSNTNVVPGSPVLASLGPLTISPFTGSTTTGLIGNTVNPYALTLGAHIVQNGGTTTGNAVTVAVVSEPSHVVLLGLGLVGLGVFLTRRARRS
jgi:hypothetical protein